MEFFWQALCTLHAKSGSILLAGGFMRALPFVLVGVLNWMMPNVLLAVDTLREQLAAVNVDSKTVCTTNDPNLALDPKLNPGYQSQIIKLKPLKTIETVRLMDGERVSVTQTGCADIQIRIEIALESSCRSKDLLKCAAKSISALKLRSDSLFVTRDLLKSLRDALGEVKTRRGALLCLHRLEPNDKNSECVSGVNIAMSKNTITLLYTDRP